MPSPSALASSLPLGAERHPGHAGRVSGQHAFLLLLGEQGCHGGTGLGGGEDAPGGDGELPGDHGIGGGKGEAFGGELAGEGKGVLPGGIGGVVHRDPGGGDGCQSQDEEASDHGLPLACGSAVGVVAGVEEVAFCLAERGVAGGVGADPVGGVGGCLQQAAAVEVGRVAGVVCPVGGGVVQPCAGDPVGVGVGQPFIAQQRPSGQQRLVADFDRAGGEGEQPFGGEGFQDCLYVLGLDGALAFSQFRLGGAIGVVHTLGAGRGQPGEDLPRGGLLAGGESVVGALGAARDGAFDAAGARIVGQGDSLPGPAAPGLVQGVRQQWQYPRAGDCWLAGARLG